MNLDFIVMLMLSERPLFICLIVNFVFFSITGLAGFPFRFDFWNFLLTWVAKWKFGRATYFCSMRVGMGWWLGHERACYLLSVSGLAWNNLSLIVSWCVYVFDSIVGVVPFPTNEWWSFSTSPVGSRYDLCIWSAAHVSKQPTVVSCEGRWFLRLIFFL